MKDSLPKVPGLNIIERETGVLKQTLIRIQRIPIRGQDEDQRRDGFDDLPQLSFVLADPLLGLLCGSDIRHCPDELEGVRVISDRMAHHVQVLDRAVRHQQSMLKIHLRAAARCTIDRLLDETKVVRMDPLEYTL